VVERKTTTSYWARLASLNAVLSSVASTVKSLAVPRAWSAAIPCGIESCRKPAVSEKTRIFSSGSAGASATVTEPVIEPCTSHRNV
jgi:hypothetical protein